MNWIKRKKKPFTTQGETETERYITEMIDGGCSRLPVTEGRTEKKKKLNKKKETKQKARRRRTWFNVFFHSDKRYKKLTMFKSS